MDIIEASKDDSLYKWRDFFDNEDVIIELEKIDELIPDKTKFVPHVRDIFKPFTYRSPDSIRVCIICDTPYNSYLEHQENIPKANGLPLSIREEDTHITDELINIYGEIGRCYKNFERPDHGSLERWFKNGVLILNSTFMIKAGTYKDSSMWIPFINLVIKRLTENHHPVFLLWCSKQKQEVFKTLIKKFMIEGVPPKYKNFVGCDNFRMVNNELKKRGEKIILWKKL